jgi:hypothetical protein
VDIQLEQAPINIVLKQVVLVAAKIILVELALLVIRLPQTRPKETMGEMVKVLA